MGWVRDDLAGRTRHRRDRKIWIRGERSRQWRAGRVVRLAGVGKVKLKDIVDGIGSDGDGQIADAARAVGNRNREIAIAPLAAVDIAVRSTIVRKSLLDQHRSARRRDTHA